MGDERTDERSARAAEAFVYAVVGYIVPSPIVNTWAELFAAKDFAREFAAKLTTAEAERLVRETVKLVKRRTGYSKFGAKPKALKSTL
jgi:hypothetical protein